MLMKDDRKKIATMIVSSNAPEDMKEAPKNEEGDEIDSSVGHQAAADEIMAAIEKKDSKLLAEALKSFYEMCRYESED